VELWFVQVFLGGYGAEAGVCFEDGGVVRPAVGEARHVRASTVYDEGVLDTVQLFKRHVACLICYGTL